MPSGSRSGRLCPRKPGSACGTQGLCGPQAQGGSSEPVARCTREVVDPGGGRGAGKNQGPGGAPPPPPPLASFRSGPTQPCLQPGPGGQGRVPRRGGPGPASGVGEGGGGGLFRVFFETNIQPKDRQTFGRTNIEALGQTSFCLSPRPPNGPQSVLPTRLHPTERGPQAQLPLPPGMPRGPAWGRLPCSLLSRFESPSCHLAGVAVESQAGC